MTHAVEATYAREANPVSIAMALQGIEALGRALPAIVADPSDGGARSDAQFGAWICGTCLETVGMALHHKLCHVLGGSFGLPHAETHAVILPHAAAVVPMTWMAVASEWQRDWARPAALPALTELLLQHGGATGSALAWETQLLAAAG